MNFDTKYLIRWGIPGWIFIVDIVIVLAATRAIDLNILSKNGIQLLGSVLIVLPVGVIVGYLFYQLYFILVWIVGVFNSRPMRASNVLKEKGYKIPSNKDEAYFLLETKWHGVISELPADKMNYISERYTHLLRKAHEMGSLFISMSFCTVSGLALIGNAGLTVTTIGPVLISFCLLIYTLSIYKYYSKNADYFMAEILRDLLKKAD